MTEYEYIQSQLQILHSDLAKLRHEISKLSDEILKLQKIENCIDKITASKSATVPESVRKTVAYQLFGKRCKDLTADEKRQYQNFIHRKNK